ncbi:Pre-mRNA-splicing factor 38A [Hondaea fermentalgiana]|uniref:Pre-mRNA-splicing factor 38 n=1 Tax=Hondaea fermentalgiana TaxID=2315210 RepID=A0A2R5GI02_9STRA|nr:Pre-mRNA-splicing factor 38A [Hondaea fermentalgiana]|eukprot:GBG30517.1 Pre-mRNA-splicing factor 38A [Hondaea fermentalgiana]
MAEAQPAAAAAAANDGALSRPLVHGTDPVNLVERILRLRVYESAYWQQYCFGVNAADLVDRAADLEYIGATASETNKPTPFICLLVKMLQIAPELAISRAMLDNEEFKYMRALAAMYVRMTARPADVYRLLEPLMSDYRKLRVQTKVGWELTTMDDFIDTLLEEDMACSIALPRLALRSVLVQARLLPPERQTVLRDKIANGGLADDASIPSLLDDVGDLEGESENGDDNSSRSDASSVEEPSLATKRARNEMSVSHDETPKRVRQDDNVAETHVELVTTRDDDNVNFDKKEDENSESDDSDDVLTKSSKKKSKKEKKSKHKREHNEKKEKKKKKKKKKGKKDDKKDKPAKTLFVKGLKQHSA